MILSPWCFKLNVIAINEIEVRLILLTSRVLSFRLECNGIEESIEKSTVN